MINLAPKEFCTACGACAFICKKTCISMQKDIEGKLYPIIDSEKCVSCHACEKVCPILNEPTGEMPKKVFAAWSFDAQQRKTSASGGVAYELYNYAIDNGYAVVGASFDSDMSVSLKLAFTKDEIKPFKNSKYVFSNCYSLYPVVKKNIDDGKKILFAGVSCQIAAMRKLFPNNDNLLYVEILCHGMVSHSYLSQHIKQIENNYRKKAYSMSFRAPENNTSSYTFSLYDYNGERFYAASKYDGDTYQIGYSTGSIYLENCYNCRFAKEDRVGDIILCDFYGLGKKIPFQYDKNDVSCVLTITDKGRNFLNNVFATKVLFFEERPLKEAIEGNPRLHCPTPNVKSHRIFRKNILSSQGDYEYSIAPVADAFMKSLNRSKMYYHWQGVKYRFRRMFRK